MKKRPVIERFMEKVTPNSQGCWIWTASQRDAYGDFWLPDRMHKAHRVSYMLFVGPIPDQMDVLHSCDNPLCVQPEHLWLGTDKDNAADRDMKGRSVYVSGERHGSAKLSQKQVEEIRKKYQRFINGYTILSREYGVGRGAIRDIIKNKTWRQKRAAEREFAERRQMELDL